MVATNPTPPSNGDAADLRDAWLHRLSLLIEQVETWATELGWATRRIEKRLDDSQIGAYQAPALLLQEETVRVLLEPIGHSAPGAEGVVDLYIMPAYDDIASLYYHGGGWQLYYMRPGETESVSTWEGQSKSLSRQTLADVLGEMKSHVG